MELERMEDFFAARVDMYDEHMLCEVEGCREGYQRLAALLGADVETLLDLGCGTGLELDAIFARLPNVRVTGVDLTKAMLDRLLQKHPDKRLELICKSYLDVDFGAARFDAAVSFQTLHHLTRAEKAGLYLSVFAALKPGAIYAECDYMVLEQAEEDFYRAENRRLRAKRQIPEGAFYHYDTPCTVDAQIELLQGAGFAPVRLVWREENTTLLCAQKPER